MKSSREPLLPAWLARTLAIGLFVILALMPVHALLSTWGGTAIGPLWLWKSWKEILLVVLAALAMCWVLWNASARRIVLRDRLAQVIAAYTGLTVVLALFNASQVGAAATSAGLAMNLRYVLIALIAFILFRFAKWDWGVVTKRVLVALAGVGVVLAVLGILQVTVLPRDLLTNFGYEKNTTIAPYMTIDENPQALRAFATLRGPNDFGAFLILPLVVVFMLVKRMSWKVVAAAVVAAGVTVSMSRSAWIGAITAVVVLLTLTYGNSVLRSKRFIYGSLLGLFAMIILVFAAVSVPELRLAIFRSSPTDPSLTEGSTDQHLLATLGGLTRVGQNPFGCGPGCAGPASYYGAGAQISENYYVQIAEEVGVAGLALWLAIAYLIAKRLYEQREDMLARALLASFVGLSVIGLWLHVWSDDPLSLTWWGLTGAVLGYYASVNIKKTVR